MRDRASTALVAVLSFIVGILLVLGTIGKEQACGMACRGDSKGYSYEPGKCECIP